MGSSKLIRLYAAIAGDLFHYGHISFFQKARELGDYLIIGVHSDKTVSDYKRTPVIKEYERYEMIKNCRLVDEVIEDAPYETTEEFIVKNKIDLVVSGDDHVFASFHKDPIRMGIMKYVQYTHSVSSTSIILRALSQYHKMIDVSKESREKIINRAL